MKIEKVVIHNYRSIVHMEIECDNFLMLVGANNAGKSNVINAIRCFYGDLKWTEEDFPKIENLKDDDSWVEITYKVGTRDTGIDDKLKKKNLFVVRQYFKVLDKSKKLGCYAIISNAKGKGDDLTLLSSKQKMLLGKIIYVPAVTTVSEQLKTTGASPLRDILAHIIEKNIRNNEKYQQIQKGLMALNQSNNGTIFSEIEKAINKNLNEWNIEASFSINEISESDLLKNLIMVSFKDKNISNESFGLDRFGSGFQRSVIFELLQEASNFHNKNSNSDGNFTLLLFEEPEAFLHPAQQENLLKNLQRIAKNGGQVFITTHSSTFVGKCSGSLAQIRRLSKASDGNSKVYYLSKDNLTKMYEMNESWSVFLQQVLSNSKESVNDIENKDKYRYQIWIDAEKAAMFFADKVLLVEGETEKVLFNYLLSNKWSDLSIERVFILNVLGKYNIPRYMNLLSEFGIPFGILFDSDQTKINDVEREKHRKINEYIQEHRKKIECVLGEHCVFSGDLEAMLGVPKPSQGRGDLKPINILEWIINDSRKGKQNKLQELREIFCKVLGINEK